MSEAFLPARAIPPSRHIRRELTARGWAVVRLVPMTGMKFEVCLSLVENGTRITPDIAARLGRAFGTSADLWMNLENDYQAALERHGVK